VLGDAQYNVGVMLIQAVGHARDETAGLEWMRRAAERDHPESLFTLGEACVSGNMVEKDEKKGAEYFRRSADRGNTDAMFNMGVTHVPIIPHSCIIHFNDGRTEND
jgi:TPR repeat protein